MWDMLEWLSSLFKISPLTTSDIILLLTLVVVWIYTKATQKINELQISPLIILKFKETTINGNLSRDGKITAKNIGKGPAYNINFLPFILNEGKDNTYIYTFYIENRTLEAGEEVELKKWIETPCGGVESSGMTRFLFRLLPNSLFPKDHIEIQAKTPALFTINYIGVNNKKYHSVYRLYSVLPPVGDIVMQLLHYGSGKIGKFKSKILNMIKGYLPHEGTLKRDKENWILRVLSHLHKFILFLNREFAFRKERNLFLKKKKLK